MATLIRLKQIESGSALQTSADLGTDFTGSVYEIIDASGLISSSTQLDGSTFHNITIAPSDSDSYSLIISGAVAVVDANNLPNGGIGDNDTNVPAQIWLNRDSILPTDPSISGSAQANIIDQGEW